MTDLPAACKRAAELGGAIVPGFPFNLSEGTGAIGLVLYLSGHPMGLYSRTPLASAVPPAKRRLRPDPGARLGAR